MDLMSYASLAQCSAQEKEKATLMPRQLSLTSEKGFFRQIARAFGRERMFPIRRKTALTGDIRRADIGIYGENNRISSC